MAAYAAFHRNQKNVFTHFFGIPLVVLSLFIGLSHFGAAWIFSSVILIYFAVLDWISALIVLPCALFLLCLSQKIVDLPKPYPLGLFCLTGVVGWVLQFLGHHYEGKRPAFFSDLSQLLNGPLFLAAKLSTLWGKRPELKKAIYFDIGE